MSKDEFVVIKILKSTRKRLNEQAARADMYVYDWVEEISNRADQNYYEDKGWSGWNE